MDVAGEGEGIGEGLLRGSPFCWTQSVLVYEPFTYLSLPISVPWWVLEMSMDLRAIVVIIVESPDSSSSDFIFRL